MAYTPSSIQIRCSLGGAVPAGLNVWHAELEDPYTDAHAQTVVDAIRDFYTAIADRFVTGSNWTIGSQVLRIGFDPPLLAAVTPRVVAGTQSGDLLPLQTTLTLKLRGAAVSRRYRGRVHLSPFMEADNTGGAPTSATITDVNGAVTSALTPYLTTALPYIGINSRLDATIHPAIQAQCSPSWTVLRSRRR